ncbi:MAG: urea carboxylase-associated family protein [Pseudomonadota bacterium]|nr:urea carboxylase-associated family protein [Pseudomonadota bacterium]
MHAIKENLVKKNSGWAATIEKNQVLRLTAQTIIDFVAFDKNNYKEAFDQAPTKEANRCIYLKKGHQILSRSGSLLMTMIEDQFQGLGTHDLQFGMCGRARHKRAAREGRLNEYLHQEKLVLPDHGCAENLTRALEPWGIPYENIPSPVNFFQNMSINQMSGCMTRTQTRPKNPVSLELRAETNLLVAFSACPDMASKTGGLGVKVSVLKFS